MGLLLVGISGAGGGVSQTISSRQSKVKGLGQVGGGSSGAKFVGKSSKCNKVANVVDISLVGCGPWCNKWL